jgi:GTP pyrophosphokinase
MVHSDIGNTCVGAKVNGRVVPLRTQLANGDQVEIITSKNQTASPSWEKFVVTGKARSEIRKVVHAEQKGQYIKLGRNILHKALKAKTIEDENKQLEEVCKFYGKTPDDLLFAVGEGTITREEVLKRVKPKNVGLSSAISLFGLIKRKKVSSQNHENLVPIKGLISGMAMHYAKCCHPLPGDKIVGVVHTGSGVTIHTSDCEMLGNYSSIPERILDLTWDSDISNIPFICRIKIILLNKASALATVSAEIARDGGNIINFKIIGRNPDYFEMTFDIEVKSREHVEEIINSLRTKKIVQQVERVRY